MDKDYWVLAGILIGVGIPVALMVLVERGIIETPFT